MCASTTGCQNAAPKFVHLYLICNGNAKILAQYNLCNADECIINFWHDCAAEAMLCTIIFFAMPLNAYLDKTSGSDFSFAAKCR